MIALAIGTTTAVLGQSPLELTKGKTLLLNETANDNRKVYVSAGEKTAFYIHDMSRLFPVRKSVLVQILDVRTKKDNVEISYISDHLGKGKIRVYGADTPELMNAVVRSAFDESVGSGKATFVLNKDSDVIHFAGANHLPVKESLIPISTEEVASGKHKKCSLCFFHIPKVSGYDLERTLGNYVAGQVQIQNSLITDDRIQQKVRDAGERVLSRWPMPLKGYMYKFYAVDSEVPNAFAVPGGRVYITSGLLDSLESNEELEAVLAHEIAHVEFRHGYRQFRSAQKAAAWGALFSILVAGTNNQAALDLTNMMAQLASSIALSGYSRRYESEADSMAFIYFETNKLGKGKFAFENVLKKLQYNQDYFEPEAKGTSSLFSSHPGMAERIDAVRHSKMSLFGDKDVFYGYDEDGEIVATISFQAQRVYSGTLNDDDAGLQVVALVETTAALGEGVQIKDLTLQTDAGPLFLDNKEDTLVLPNDAVGASLVSKTQKQLIGEITGVSLKMKNVVKWEKKPRA